MHECNLTKIAATVIEPLDRLEEVRLAVIILANKNIKFCWPNLRIPYGPEIVDRDFCDSHRLPRLFIRSVLKGRKT